MPNTFLTLIISIALLTGLSQSAFAKKGGGGKNNNGGGGAAQITIQEQPASVTAFAGDNVSFNVDASVNKGPSIKYQWYFNGNEISFATSSQLTLSNIDASNEGEYHVKLRSGDRISTSQTSQLILDSTVVINLPPVAYDDSTTMYEDTETAIDVLNNDHDADGDTLNITLARATKGTISINNNTIRYTPPENFYGQDTAFYSVEDGNGGTASAMVSIQILAVNDAPTAVNDTASTNEDTPVTINVLSNDSDTEGHLISVSSASASNGDVSISSIGELTYKPYLDFNGIDTISYSITDTKGASSNATVVVTINPIEDLRITYQPSSASVYIGSSHTLNVSAVGNGNLNYQWRKNGVDIFDTNSSYLTLDNISILDSGQYEVIVSDSIEQLYSNTITIDVLSTSGLVLNWDFPQYREDGSLLPPSEIKSYRIYIAQESSGTEQILIVSGDTTSYKIEDLGSDSYSIWITTVDVSGLEGASSESISTAL